MTIGYDKQWLLDYCKYISYDTEYYKESHWFRGVVNRHRDLYINQNKIDKPVWDMCLYYLNGAEGDKYFIERSNSSLNPGDFILHDLENELRFFVRTSDIKDTLLSWGNEMENILFGSILRYIARDCVYEFTKGVVVDVVYLQQKERELERSKQERSRFCKMFGGDK